MINDRRLGAQAASLLNDPNKACYASAISISEIAIKYVRGKITGAPPFSGTDAMTYCRRAGYTFSDLRPDHAAVLDSLPLLHKDPFDRLLIAQAFAEPMKLVTRDAKLAAYGQMIVVV